MRNVYKLAVAGLHKKAAFRGRSSTIPYGRQWIDEDDIQAVVEVLRSDWLTTGPKVTEFERIVADYSGAEHGVAVNSGTAALHCAMNAAGVGPGDEVIVPPMTFASTVNSVVFQGGTPVFADVDPETLLMDPAEVEQKVTDKTKAIIAVDYAGQPCDFERLREIAATRDVALIDDACHALGAEYKGRKIGTWADMTVFSFHPVKHITTGEGGMVLTQSDEYEKSLRLFRNHGISTDHYQRARQGSWFYEMVDLGFNYRISDIQCALGISQMKKIYDFLQRRRQIAARYDEAFKNIEGVTPLAVRQEVVHAYHLYVVRIDPEKHGKNRDTFFQQLQAKGVGVNVHYIPVYLHPFYQKRFATGPGLCPVAETVYQQIVSLPIFPAMNKNDVERVIRCVETLGGHKLDNGPAEFNKKRQLI
ncbi:MAG: UDP-4-amino-4,6-dideoxy-N-acetyl-beta-L-altrosamine transaminase [Proteobacteria bacterium]|nr:UDP-4-amino-4,6-dideoxy-N-acetyl-beta-L-altrosamine transaminase [Pseudomonadota bacterium]